MRNVMLFVNKEIRILSLSFLLIFLGFNGIQQYITTFFSDIGLPDLGFRSLILIYLFFTLGDPLSAIFVSKYGAKACMIVSSLAYFVYIISLLSGSAVIIYLSSSLLGIAASLLWTGQNSYLIRASDRKHYGASSGFFNSFQSIGSALGVLAFSFFISIFLFNTSFLIFSLFPIAGFLLLFKLKDLRTEQKTGYADLVKRSITSITALRLSSIWFAVNFVYGLVIGIIPLEVKDMLGVSYVGVAASLFYILPVILSYFFGKISDTRGRTKMIILSYGLLVVGLISLLLSGSVILLLLGIFLLALNWTITKPVTYALVGDVTTENNLEYLTALFWMVQSIGIVSSLILSQSLKLEPLILYFISIAVVIVSFVILLPILRLNTEEIKRKISQEMG